MRKPKRRYKKLTDADILRLIEAGRYYVDSIAGKVYSVRNGVLKELTQEPDRRDWLKVRLFDAGARRKIAVHRIVWMNANRQVIPDGYEVHHGKDGKAVNGIHNLLCREGTEHNWYHAYMSSPALREKYATYDDYREYRRSVPPDSIEDFYRDFD